MNETAKKVVSYGKQLTDTELLDWKNWEHCDILSDHFCTFEFKNFDELFKECLRVFHLTMLESIDEIEEDSLAWSIVWCFTVEAYRLGKGEYP